MLYIFALFVLCAAVPAQLVAQTSSKDEPGKILYVIRPAFSFLMSTVQKTDGEALALSMYGQLRSKFTTDISSVHLKSYLNVDLVRKAYSDASPVYPRYAAISAQALIAPR